MLTRMAVLKKRKKEKKKIKKTLDPFFDQLYLQLPGSPNTEIQHLLNSSHSDHFANYSRSPYNIQRPQRLPRTIKRMGVLSRIWCTTRTSRLQETNKYSSKQFHSFYFCIAYNAYPSYNVLRIIIFHILYHSDIYLQASRFSQEQNNGGTILTWIWVVWYHSKCRYRQTSKTESPSQSGRLD